MSATLVRAHRRDIEALLALALGDLSLVWAQIGDEPYVVREALQDLLPELAGVYGSAAATLGADWYDEMREASGARGTFRAIPAELPDRGRTDSLARWAISPLFGAEPDLGATRALVEGGFQRIVADADRNTVLGSSSQDPRGNRWQRETTGKSCQFCLMLAGRGAIYRADTADFQAHDNCVVPGTLVTSPMVEAAYRRWYQGELIVIGVAGGEELSITPNHPVLTDRGWVDAGLLREGDEVVQRAGADLASLQVPHEDEVPARIEDVWSARRMDGLASVPVAAEDFHGDGAGTDGEVEVVAPNGLFPDVFYAEGRQLLMQPVGAGARPSAVATALLAQRRPSHRQVGPRAASDGGVSRLSLHRSFLRGHLCRSHQRSLTAAPDRHAGFGKPSTDDPSRDPVQFSQSQFRESRGVLLRDSLDRRDSHGRRASGPGTRYDPSPSEGNPQPLAVHADLGRRLLERLAGGVKLGRVSELRRIEYSGHVLNLRTVEGWYDANSLVVSNCDCLAVPSFG